MKRDVGIAYIVMMKIRDNVMQFKDTLSVDEAEVLTGQYSFCKRKICVLHGPEESVKKYTNAWLYLESTLINQSLNFALDTKLQINIISKQNQKIGENNE